MVEILQGDVKVPGIGKVKKAYIYVPAGIAGVYVVWRWYQAGQEEPAPGADGFYDPDLSEMGLSTRGGPTNIGGNTGAVETDATRDDVLDTNAEWTNKAVELLANAGYDPITVYGVLGEFLARQALDKDEAIIARAAIAAAGEPPVGRPWEVIEEATTGGNGKPPAPTNLRAWGDPTSTKIGMQWDPVEGFGLGYRIYRNLGENIGHSIDTKFSARGLQPGTSYTFSVAALSSTGKPGPQSAEVTLKTAGASTSDPDPEPSPSPSPAPKPTPRPSKRTVRITRRGQTLGDLVAAYNRRYGTSHTWQSVWNFNLKHRNAATRRKLRARGPHKTFMGSSFWIPT